MYVSFIKEIFNSFLANSAMAIFLLAGEYLMKENLNKLLLQCVKEKKREVTSLLF